MEKVTKVTLTPYVVDGTLVPASEETNAITTEAYVGEYCDWDLSESCGPCPDPNCDTCNPGHDDYDPGYPEDEDKGDLDCSCGLC